MIYYQRVPAHKPNMSVYAGRNGEKYGKTVKL